jgi:hypothetical protein
MKTIFKLLPHEAETAIKSALNEAEMIAGRNLTDEQKSTIVRFLLDDVKTKFNWLTVPYLYQAIRNGLSSDFKYLDYKTICKWFWEFKNLPEMRLKIILNTPLTPTNVPEFMPVNWFMEVNKAYYKFCNGELYENHINTAIYSRLLLDGYFKINTYKRYYDHEEKADIDIERVWQAQRKIVLDQFAEFKMQGAEYIYSPNQYLKNGN